MVIPSILFVPVSLPFPTVSHGVSACFHKCFYRFIGCFSYLPSVFPPILDSVIFCIVCTFYVCEGVYMTIGNPDFCLFLYLTGVYFRGELQHGVDVIIKKSSVDQSELEK